MEGMTAPLEQLVKTQLGPSHVSAAVVLNCRPLRVPSIVKVGGVDV